MALTVKLTGYEVELAADGNHKIFVRKARKPAGFGYAYTSGNHEYRSTIKPGGAIWKRKVKEAQGRSRELGITDEDVADFIARAAEADRVSPVE